MEDLKDQAIFLQTEEERVRAKKYRERNNYFITTFSHAVEADGVAGAGTASETTHKLDKDIDWAISELVGRIGILMKPISITHSPVKYRNRTHLLVTIVCEPIILD